MGKQLHQTIPPFVEDRLIGHDVVAALRKIEHADYFVYEIDRVRYGDTLRVFLSDQYTFTEFDFFQMERNLSAGDFILVARPEAGFTDQAKAEASQKRIGLGKFGDLMGALNLKRTWLYTPKKTARAILTR